MKMAERLYKEKGYKRKKPRSTKELLKDLKIEREDLVILKLNNIISEEEYNVKINVLDNLIRIVEDLKKDK